MEPNPFRTALFYPFELRGLIDFPYRVDSFNPPGLYRPGGFMRHVYLGNLLVDIVT